VTLLNELSTYFFHGVLEMNALCEQQVRGQFSASVYAIYLQSLSKNFGEM